MQPLQTGSFQSKQLRKLREDVSCINGGLQTEPANFIAGFKNIISHIDPENSGEASRLRSVDVSPSLARSDVSGSEALQCNVSSSGSNETACSERSRELPAVG